MTRKYCSPETAHDGYRGRKSDIFSLGCVFLEMLSFLLHDLETSFRDYQWKHFVGDGVFHENLDSVKEWLKLLLSKATKQPRELDFTEVIKSCKNMMEADPDDRPSAKDLARCLLPGFCCEVSPILPKPPTYQRCSGFTRSTLGDRTLTSPESWTSASPSLMMDALDQICIGQKSRSKVILPTSRETRQIPREPKRALPQLAPQSALVQPQDVVYKFVLQPEAKPSPQEQLVVEVNGIYKGLVMAEPRCVGVGEFRQPVTTDLLALEKRPQSLPGGNQLPTTPSLDQTSMSTPHIHNDQERGLEFNQHILSLPSVSAPFAMIIGGLFMIFDTIVWLSMCFALACSIIFTGIHEAFFDNRVIRFLIQQQRNTPLRLNTRETDVATHIYNYNCGILVGITSLAPAIIVFLGPLSLTWVANFLFLTLLLLDLFVVQGLSNGFSNLMAASKRFRSLTFEIFLLFAATTVTLWWQASFENSSIPGSILLSYFVAKRTPQLGLSSLEEPTNPTLITETITRSTIQDLWTLPTLEYHVSIQTAVGVSVCFQLTLIPL